MQTKSQHPPEPSQHWRTLDGCSSTNYYFRIQIRSALKPALWKIWGCQRLFWKKKTTQKTKPPQTPFPDKVNLSSKYCKSINIWAKAHYLQDWDSSGLANPHKPLLTNRIHQQAGQAGLVLHLKYLHSRKDLPQSSATFQTHLGTSHAPAGRERIFMTSPCFKAQSAGACSQLHKMVSRQVWQAARTCCQTADIPAVLYIKQEGKVQFHKSTLVFISFTFLIKIWQITTF